MWGIHPDPYSTGQRMDPDSASGGEKIPVWVLGIDPALDGMPIKLDLLLPVT
jgi:hypothetical protein